MLIRNLPVAALAISLMLGAAPTMARDSSVWVRTAGASARFVDPAKAAVLQNVTVREPFRITLGGDSFRIQLSNEHGIAPLVIGAATLSYDDNGQTRFVPLTFSDQRAFSVPPGAPMLSDAVDLPLKPFSVVWLNLYLPEATPAATMHRDNRNVALISAPGDFTQVQDMPVAQSVKEHPFFMAIEVEASKKTRTIVAYGDSITDADCAYSASPCRWSDVLAQRLQAVHKPFAVANEAISGNRILRENTGTNGLARFDRDVLSVPNVAYVVLLEGVNDLGNSGPPPGVAPPAPPPPSVVDTATPASATPAPPPAPVQPYVSADDLIAGYKQLIARAHERGIKVIGAEILPFKGAKYYSEDKDAVRITVNTWIRTSGAFDGLVDFAGAVADPADPLRLNAALEIGDHLHPSEAGQRAMGEVIDLKLFK